MVKFVLLLLFLYTVRRRTILDLIDPIDLTGSVVYFKGMSLLIPVCINYFLSLCLKMLCSQFLHLDL